MMMIAEGRMLASATHRQTHNSHDQLALGTPREPIWELQSADKATSTNNFAQSDDSKIRIFYTAKENEEELELLFREAQIGGHQQSSNLTTMGTSLSLSLNKPLSLSLSLSLAR